MEIHKCIGCMEDCREYPCPKCGYDPKTQIQAEYALKPETILNGKYLVGRVLGQGGFGITYIGWDLVFDRKVAIKEYYPSGQVSRSPGTTELTWYTSDRAVSARSAGMEIFLREAQKMSKVEDIPGVVRIRDIFPNNQTAYIVMDYIEGETLKQRLQRTGPMTWEQSKEIFRSAIRSMEKVHKAGLIHRDLSPDNLMLTPAGAVMILDLGAAKDLSSNSGVSSMKVAKSGFSPWEQYTQSGTSGPWTDVYAMAATIYYTLTGKMPPTAMDRQDKDTLEWNAPNLLSLPPQVLRTLKKAMALGIRDRIQSMQDLEAGLYMQTTNAVTGEVRSVPSRKKKLLPIAAAAVILVGTAVWMTLIRPAVAYSAAAALMKDGKYSEAAQIYDKLGNYKDSKDQADVAHQEQTKVERYDAAKNMMDAGKYAEAADAFQALGDYKDSEKNAEDAASRYQYQLGTELKKQGKYLQAARAFIQSSYDDSEDQAGDSIVEFWSSQMHILAAGDTFSVAQYSDGTFATAGANGYGQCDLDDWTDIIALSAGYDFTVGLREDLTVVAKGHNYMGQCDVSDWSDIVMISAGSYHTMGLRADGTVVATGYDNDGQVSGVSDWEDIVAIAAGNQISVGLKLDGTVVAVGLIGSSWGDISQWEDIVAIGAGEKIILGVHSDGTVVAVGANTYNQCNVEDWTDVVAVDAGYDFSIGLCSDGTVVAAGDISNYGFEDWTDISEISAGNFQVLGLKNNKVVCGGYNTDGQCDIQDW